MAFYKKIQLILIIAFGGSKVFAQQTPAPPQSQPIIITGAVAHIGNGQVIENSAIAFEEGKITLVADARLIRIDGSKNYKTIDATGKHVYPGFIAPNTTVGLVEVSAVRATRDYSEVGQMNPNIRSIIAYNTDSKVTPTIRSNGVLLAQITPRSGRISGSSSIVELDAWNWEDALYREGIGIHLNWPSMFSRSRGNNVEVINKNKNYDKQIQELEAFFEQAQAFSKKKEVKTENLKFEAMRGLFDKSKKLFVHTNRAKTIMESTLFAKKYGVDIVIVGGRDSWRITEFLKENKVPVIIRSTQSLPGSEDEDIDQPFKTPVQLHEAGVLFCFSHSGFDTQRNLPFQAGQAVGFGLEYEEAIKSLSLNTAKILGIDQSVGSLEEGKDATLFISEGDVLDMRACKVVYAFIRGKEIDLDNKQKALYRKFKAKYETQDK
jgi:imidazolonepropionase-like amidohydrolase